MIDWYPVGVASVWICALAELLAALSVAYFFAGQQSRPLRQLLGESPFRLAIACGSTLFALGILLSVNEWWERIGWAGVLAIALWQTIRARQAHHTGAG